MKSEIVFVRHKLQPRPVRLRDTEHEIVDPLREQPVVLNQAATTSRS
jgi:hypothetical protein